MQNMMMGSLDGENRRVAFDVNILERIVSRENARLMKGIGNPGAVVEVGQQSYSLVGSNGRTEMEPYLLLLRCGCAFNVTDYRLLFKVKRLPHDLVSGTDASGEEVICPSWEPGVRAGHDSQAVELEGKLLAVHDALDELKDMRETLARLKNGEFFEALAMELSGKMKEAAQEFIDFRIEFGKRIEPEIVQIASKDIPEASNQLEGINETLEESTMKIMDINEELMSLADECLAASENLVRSAGHAVPEGMLKGLEGQTVLLRGIKALSLKMMEPLSFQDLVGQRIQRIIRLVKSMEVRIEDMIVSFGLKVRMHKEDPGKTFEDLRKEVEHYQSELKGPQRDGEGMDQAQIDDLLATL